MGKTIKTNNTKSNYGVIYKISNTINEKCYIGQTTKKIEVRFKEHIHAAIKESSSSILHRAMKKYGIENFFIEEIDTAVDRDDLNKKEIYWISFYNSNDRAKGYNMTPGGEGGDTRTGRHDTVETILKRVTSNKLYYKNRSEEEIEKARQNGRTSWLMTCGNRDRELIDRRAKTLKITLNTKKDLRISHFIEVHSDEFKQDFYANMTYKQLQEKYSQDKFGLVDSDIKVVVNKLNLYRSYHDHSGKMFEVDETTLKNIKNDFSNGLSNENIMKKYNLSNSEYYRLRRQLNISRSKKTISKRSYDVLYNEQLCNEIIKFYSTATLVDTANNFNISSGLVVKVLDKYNIKKHTPRESQLLRR